VVEGRSRKFWVDSVGWAGYLGGFWWVWWFVLYIPSHIYKMGSHFSFGRGYGTLR
jgi:hypothetical protein